jgi:hypothetical protein
VISHMLGSGEISSDKRVSEPDPRSRRKQSGYHVFAPPSYESQAYVLCGRM